MRLFPAMIFTSFAKRRRRQDLTCWRPVPASYRICGLKASYDYILIDAPAVLARADASALAACADGVVLVVESGKEEPKTVQLAKKRLEQAKAKILGCVLNNMKVDRRYDEFCRMRGDAAC